MVLAGHSLGAGFVAYLGHQFTVRRVIQFAGPADAPDWLPLQPAGWLTLPSATPASRYYGLVHLDDVGPSSMDVSRVAKVLNNWDVIGMSGPVVDVDFSTPPYGGSHRLITTRCLDADPGDSIPCDLQSASDKASAAHSAFIVNGPENNAYAPVWDDVLN